MIGIAQLGNDHDLAYAMINQQNLLEYDLRRKGRADVRPRIRELLVK
jgi:hypothetical protein